MVWKTKFKVVGLDLAGKDSNYSGICLLFENTAKVKLLKTNDEIIEFIIQNAPDAIGIDAPLTIEDRICDKLLKKYGAMPLKLQSIYDLAKRAIELKESFRKISNASILEVFPTATAKILGFYKKNFNEKISIAMETLKISLEDKIKDDEFDAFIGALTTKLYLKGYTQSIGDEKGCIIIPNKTKIEKILKMIRATKIKITKLDN